MVMMRKHLDNQYMAFPQVGSILFFKRPACHASETVLSTKRKSRSR
jgi:hypothetical protein